MARAKPESVLAAVERDLAVLPVRPGMAGLAATARILAGVLDGDGPSAPRVAAAKTLVDVLAQLRGTSARGGGDDGDGVDRLKRGQARRRGAPA